MKVITGLLLIFSTALFAYSQSEVEIESQTPPTTLSVGWELWYPYQYHNNKQELVGLDFEILNAIVKQANLSLNYTELPWKRHLHFIKTGEMDVAMGASFNQERADYAYFTKPYRFELVKLYVKKGQAKNIKLTSLKDLIKSPFLIGVEGGYYYGKTFHKLIQKAEFKSHINEVLDIEQNVKLLLKGYVDGFLVDPVTMKAFAEKYKINGEFEQHPMTIYQDSIHIMLSKKSMSEVDLLKFNHAITTLKENGTLDKLNARWTQLQKF